MAKKVALTFLCISLIFAFVFVNFSYGLSPNFNVSAFNNKSSNAAGNSVTNIAGGILTVVRVVCVGIAMIMLAVLGMKYMLASPNDRAEIKGSAIRYILGAILMFSASAILAIIESFTKKGFEG